MRIDAREGDQVRIGVSIPIPEPYTSSLSRARIEVGDPLAHSVPPHITLLPPTVIAPGGLEPVHQHLKAVAERHTPFVVELRGTATFRPVSPVVYVRVAVGAQFCEELQESVNAGPLAQETRFPYHPHVTIAHEIPECGLDAAAEVMGGFEAIFPVAHFSLYEYGDDGVWRDEGTFTLTS